MYIYPFFKRDCGDCCYDNNLHLLLMPYRYPLLLSCLLVCHNLISTPSASSAPSFCVSFGREEEVEPQHKKLNIVNKLYIIALYIAQEETATNHE